MHVILPRSVPGGGKSTLVKKLIIEKRSKGSVVVVSADHFFYSEEEDGSLKYDFKRGKLPQAHARCMSKYIEALGNQFKFVIVDNTNLGAIELAPYISVANSFGYGHEIIEIPVDPMTAYRRQKHGVPWQQFRGMVQRYNNEKFPPYWNFAVWTSKNEPGVGEDGSGASHLWAEEIHSQLNDVELYKKYTIKD